MKRFLTFTLFISIVLAFSSCKKIKEAAYVDINTTLTAEIPVAVDTTTTEKSALVGYSFSESHTESLEENNKVKDYLDLLKRIEVNEVNIEISGLVGDQLIESIAFEVENVGTIATLENVSPSNSDFTPDINPSVLVQIANELYYTKQLSVTVSGTTNKVPMNFVVATYFDLHIEASPL